MSPPRQTTRKSAPPFEVILEAAAELFGEHGYANTTMQAIADRLGIAKPTLYVHAKSKPALLDQVFDGVLRAGDKALDRAERFDEPEEQLREFITAWIEVTMEQRTLVAVFLSSEAELPEHLVRYYRKWARKSFDRLETIVRAGQRTGAFRDELDSSVIAFAVIAMTQWVPKWFSDEGPLSLTDVAGTYTSLIETGLLRPARSG